MKKHIISNCDIAAAGAVAEEGLCGILRLLLSTTQLQKILLAGGHPD